MSAGNSHVRHLRKGPTEICGVLHLEGKESNYSPREVRLMPDNNNWSDKSERQYEHVKESEKVMGKSDGTAEEIAARTVNKERARKGEAEDAVKND